MMKRSVQSTQSYGVSADLNAGHSSGTHRNAQPQASSSSATTHALSPELQQLRPAAKSVYKQERKTHGTNLKGKASIQEEGFKKSKKDNTNAWVTDKYHYLAPNKLTAMLYAKDENPAIVRTLGAHTNKSNASSFEASTDEPGAYVEWIRTSKDIKPKHVLGSKRSPPGADAEVFRERLERRGITVNREDAGRLLRDVQSDSEDDFE